MFNDFLKRTNSDRGIYCSLFYIQNLNYKDFKKVFGEPHGISKNKTGSMETSCYWLYELFDGTKFELRYDRDDYTIKTMERLGLRSLKSIDFEDINELMIKTDSSRIVIIASFLKSIFPDCKSKNTNNHLSIKIIFEETK